jgi:hypothetical protein
MHATTEEPVSKQRIGKHKTRGVVGNGVFGQYTMVITKISAEKN